MHNFHIVQEIVVESSALHYLGYQLASGCSARLGFQYAASMLKRYSMSGIAVLCERETRVAFLR
jgi:hypothetical protein